MTKQTILRPLSRRWWRGPARLEGGAIVVDYARGDAYDPLAFPRLGLELTRVRSPADAVLFATQFGLLRHGAEHLDVDPAVRWPGRDQAQDFVDAAAALRDVVRTMVEIRRAVDGDAAALERLRSRFVAPVPSPRRKAHIPDWYAPDQQIATPPDDRTLLIHASEWTGWQLSIGLKETRAFVFDRAGRGEAAVAPGRLRVGTLPRTLLDVCYLTTAFALADREPVEVCPECERAFVVDDARQQYCQPSCASAARFRRWKAKRLRSPQKGPRHGTTTRTGRR
jgi:hypothetical protein